MKTKISPVVVTVLCLPILSFYAFGQTENNDVDSKISNRIPFYSFDGKQRVDMDKEEYRKKVLPRNIKMCWARPDQLYSLIVTTIQDGLPADVIKSAEHLIIIDKDSERSNVIYAILLEETGNIDKAEQVLDGFVQRHGETGVVLTNLAKIYAERRQDEKAEKTLWRGLTIDPNQENGMLWYVARQHEHNGKAGYIDALKKISDLKGSWRAQLYLARECLEKKDLAGAKEYYTKVLAIVSDEPDVLTMISGDLGNGGYNQEIVDIISPVYDSKKQGPYPGINLILAYINLGDLDKADNLVRKLKSFYNPVIQQRLTYFQEKIKVLKDN